MTRGEALFGAPCPIREQLPAELQPIFADANRTLALALGESQAVTEARDLYVAADQSVVLEAVPKIITAAAADEPTWGQNERDAIVTVSEAVAVPLDEVSVADQDAIVKHYSDTVRRLPQDDDYFGAPHSLYEVGKRLATGMGETADAAFSYTARMQVRDAWSNYFQAMPEGPEKAVAKEMVDDLTASLLPLNQAQAEQNEGWEWTRQQPDMKQDSLRLHDNYLNQVRSRSSFKLALHQQTPDFRQRIAEAGVDLDKFWNLTDPAQVVQGMDELRSDPKLAMLYERLQTSLAATYQLDAEAIMTNPSITRAMADQIQAAVRNIRVDIAQAMISPDDMLARVRQQVSEALTAQRPIQKLKPIRKLLHMMDISAIGETREVGEASAAELDAWLQSDEAAEQLMSAFGQRQANKAEQLETLERLFPQPAYRYLRLMRRDESDLYAADDTRDCTAYHLQNGFNGWTVPHWLANPGFNMAYIADGETRLAKLGLLLAQDETGIRLVVDSIETSKNITDHSRALLQIHTGLRELQAWSDSQGLGDVFFCTYTNSSELSMELPVTKPGQRPEMLYNVSSEGLNEFWRSMTGDNKATVRSGYLQSAEFEADDDDFEDDNAGAEEGYETDHALEAERLAAHLRLFETQLRNHMTPALTEAARRGDMRAVVMEYAFAACPKLSKVLGTRRSYYENRDLTTGVWRYKETDVDNMEDYMRESRYLNEDYYFAQLVDLQIKELKMADLVLTSVFLPAHIDNMIEIEGGHSDWPIADIGPLEDTRNHAYLRAEAENLDRLIYSIDYLTDRMSTEELLARLFGNQTAEASVSAGQKEQLSRYLMIIDRSKLLQD